MGTGSESFGRPTFAEATAKPKATFAQRAAWCAANVPGEHPPFAAMAGQTLAAIGVPVTPDSIRARLRVTGRDMETLGG